MGVWLYLWATSVWFFLRATLSLQVQYISSGDFLGANSTTLQTGLDWPARISCLYPLCSVHPRFIQSSVLILGSGNIISELWDFCPHSRQADGSKMRKGMWQILGGQRESPLSRRKMNCRKGTQMSFTRLNEVNFFCIQGITLLSSWSWDLNILTPWGVKQCFIPLIASLTLHSPRILFRSSYISNDYFMIAVDLARSLLPTPSSNR